MIYTIALVCTLVAWCAQSYTTLIKKENKLNLLMPLLYCIACIGFMVYSFTANDMLNAIMDGVIAVLALLIFIFALRGKK